MKDPNNILRVFRPNGADAATPEFTDALRESARDSALNDRFEEQLEFDAAVAAGLKATPVPHGLKSAILADRKTIRPAWWQPSSRVAAVAVLLALCAVSSLLILGERETDAAALKDQLVKGFWSENTHLEYKSSDLPQIRAWLNGRNVNSSFEFPAALEDFTIMGCRVVECDGHQGAAICLQKDLRHTHLVVLNGKDFPGLPGNSTPEFEEYRGWKTASWSQGNQFYLISGMKFWNFVKRFRKDGRWLWTT